MRTNARLSLPMIYCMSLLLSLLFFPLPAPGKSLNATVTTGDHNYDIQFYNRDNTETNWFTETNDAKAIADHFDPESGTGIHDLHLAFNLREPSQSRRDIKLEADDGNPRANYTRILLPVSILNAVGHSSSVALGICTHEGHHISQHEYIGPDSSYARSTMNPIGFEGPATAAMDAYFSAIDDFLSYSSYIWTSESWMSTYLDTDDDEGVNHNDYFWENNG